MSRTSPTEAAGLVCRTKIPTRVTRGSAQLRVYKVMSELAQYHKLYRLVKLIIDSAQITRDFLRGWMKFLVDYLRADYKSANSRGKLNFAHESLLTRSQLRRKSRGLGRENIAALRYARISLSLPLSDSLMAHRIILNRNKVRSTCVCRRVGRQYT